MANEKKSFKAALKAPQPPKGGDMNFKNPSVLNSANPAIYMELKRQAKEMRNNPTGAEAILWNSIKNNKLGIKFRQQHIIDNFIVDFCSINAGLIIEVDGEIHDQQQEADAERTKILESYGYKVIRFSNQEILENLDKVILNIQDESQKLL